MVPLCSVVSCPKCGVPLGPRECRPGEDEGSEGSFASLDDAHVSGHGVEVTVDVVHVSVLHISVVQAVLVHSHLRAIENRGFVHVVPNVHVVGCP